MSKWEKINRYLTTHGDFQNDALAALLRSFVTLAALILMVLAGVAAFPIVVLFVVAYLLFNSGHPFFGIMSVALIYVYVIRLYDMACDFLAALF